MIKDFEIVTQILTDRARELAKGCSRVFVAVSGGIDSSLVAALLCKSFSPEQVVGLYRNIRNDPKHWVDVKALQAVFGFRLIRFDGDEIYEAILKQLKDCFADCGLPWAHENSPDAEELGFSNAYASLKSRLTTPLAGFISKAIDNGNGRIFGTGNGEEDMFLRYFDKFGDGAVDNNIINGLTKAEVRQLARYLGVPEHIVTKTPSADLHAIGDGHNDEDQLTRWAKQKGYDVEMSYGACDGSCEGNIAWAWKEDTENNVITGENADLSPDQLEMFFRYTPWQVQTILFMREIERSTRHKVDAIPGLERKRLIDEGVVE